MLEQTFAPLRAQRFQRDILVAPVEREPTQVIYINARRSNYALPKCETTPHNGAAEYLWLSSNVDPLPKYGKATDSSTTDPLNTSARYNIKSVIAELEKRRARLFALTRAAEARARVAEKKFEQSENRLERETNQRLMAEATARAAEEKAQKIEALVLGAEPSDHEAEERNLVFGLLVYSNKMSEAERKTQFETKDAPIELTMWREGEYTSSNLLKSVGAKNEKAPAIMRKLIIYGSVITLLVGVCCRFIATLL
jgi:hypothetical protein